MSGCAISTLGFPPNRAAFAKMSPMDRDISVTPTYRQLARIDPPRAFDDMSVRENLRVQVTDVLVRVSRQQRLLVHTASHRLDARALGRVVRLVVARQVLYARATALREHRPRVTGVAHVTFVLDDQEDAGTGAGDVDLVEPRTGEPEELFVCAEEAIVDGLGRVLGEGRVADNELVQVVAQEVRAGVATVAVEDLRERALHRRRSRRASGWFSCPRA